MHTTFNDGSDPFSLSQRSHLVWTRGNVSVRTVDYDLKIIHKNKAWIQYQQEQFWGDFFFNFITFVCLLKNTDSYNLWNEKKKKHLHIKQKCQIETPKPWVMLNPDADLVSNPLEHNGFKKNGLWSLSSPDTEQNTLLWNAVHSADESRICETLLGLSQWKQLSSILSKAGHNHHHSRSVRDRLTDKQSEFDILSGLVTHSWHTRHSFDKGACIEAWWRRGAEHFMVRLKPHLGWYKHFSICTGQSKISVHTGILWNGCL